MRWWKSGGKGGRGGKVTATFVFGALFRKPFISSFFFFLLDRIITQMDNYHDCSASSHFRSFASSHPRIFASSHL